MRLYATSDLHADFGANWQILKNLPDGEFHQDALIVAGDIAHKIDVIEAVLTLLKRKFQRVFYVPGNHELWVGEQNGDSLEKFNEIVALCERLAIDTQAGQVDDCWVVPLFSWYDELFDEDGIGEVGALEHWADYHYCKWPADMVHPSAYFAGLNRSRIKPYAGRVISFSHFLPRMDLLPPLEGLRFKGLPKVAGAHVIENQVRLLSSQVHVFGHSHIPRDEIINKVRYVQRGLGYPRDRRQPFELAQIEL